MALTADEAAELAELRRQAAADISELSDEQIRKMRELQAPEQGSLENSEALRNQLIEQITHLEQQIRLYQTLNEIGETVVGKGAEELRQEELKLNLRRENILAQRDAGELNERELESKLKTLARIVTGKQLFPQSR